MWTVIWVSCLFVWIVLYIVANVVRAECTEDVECGDAGTCNTVTHVCVCGVGAFEPRYYRCGSEYAGVVDINDYDIVGMAFGVFGFGVLLFTSAPCCPRPRSNDHHKDDDDDDKAHVLEDSDTPVRDATTGDYTALGISTVLLASGIGLFLTAVLLNDRNSVVPTILSSLGLVAIVAAGVIFIMWPSGV